MIPEILCVIIFPSNSLASLLSHLAGFLGNTWLTGSLTYCGVISMRDKCSPSIMESMNYTLRLYLPLFLLASLLVIAGLIGFILLIVPALLLGMISYAATPALVIERKSVYGALKRSFHLSAGYRWPLFRLYTYIMIFCLLFAILLELAIYKQTILITLFNIKRGPDIIDWVASLPTGLHIDLIGIASITFIYGVVVVTSCISYMKLTQRFE